MLPQLIKYIQSHANRWPIKLRVDSQLIPLLRFNKEANRIVKSEQIGVVIFWFNRRKRNPCLVTKIMDRSLSVEYIRSCAGHQQEINKKIGISVFPSIYDITQISGYPVIFQEAINTQNYEMELSKAIYGPTGNLRLLKEVVNCHFEEIGSLFNKLKMIDVSEEITQWGDWAYSVGDDLRNNYGLRLKFLTDNCLDRMRREINSMSLQRNYVLVDHYAANYFRGPRIVDQIDRSLSKRMSNEPGIIDVFRFMIAYFRTSPLNALYKDWLDAIACSITNKEGLILTGSSVRRLLQDVGLNLDEPKKIWALVMVSCFLRGIDELTFHQHNIFLISRLRTEFEQLTQRLIEIQDLIEKDRDFDFSFALRSQESFIPPSMPMPTDNITQPPCLIEEGYEEFNIVLYRKKYYAISQSLGPVDFTCLGENKIKEYQDGGKWFMGDSLEEVKHLVDEIVNRGEQKEAGEAPREMEIIAKAISNMEENIRKLVFDMGEKDKRIDILERELSEERNSYRKLSEDLENREKTIEALIRHVSDRDDNIKRLMTGLEEESKDLNSVQKELEERDKRIQVQNERLTEKDERIGTLEKELVELDKSIDLLREEVSDKETKINILRGVNVSFSAVPVLLDSYEGYNVVQFKDRIYGISQALGSLNLTEEEYLGKYEEDGKCVIGDSVYEVKFLIGRILCRIWRRGFWKRR